MLLGALAAIITGIAAFSPLSKSQDESCLFNEWNMWSCAWMHGWMCMVKGRSICQYCSSFDPQDEDRIVSLLSFHILSYEKAKGHPTFSQQRQRLYVYLSAQVVYIGLTSHYCDVVLVCIYKTTPFSLVSLSCPRDHADIMCQGLIRCTFLFARWFARSVSWQDWSAGSWELSRWT